MSARRAIIAAGAVLAVLVVVLAWKTRGGGESPTAAPVAAVATPEPAAQAAPVASAPPAIAPAKSAIVDDQAARPQPVPLPPGETPPPLDGKKSEPAPPQKAFTPAELIAKREADLKLIDDTKARLEQQLVAANGSNDATTARDLEVRIARLTELRKKRGSELEQLKGSAQ